MSELQTKPLAIESTNVRLPAVDRAISLLELLASSNGGLTLSELSRRLSIPKSTAHYLIYTMSTRGYVQKECDGRRYSIGSRLADVASMSHTDVGLRSITAPYLRRIAARLNLTATVTTLKGAEAVIIGKVSATQDGGGAWIGRHIDLHCSAQGKALIANFSDQKLNELFGGRELAYFTPKTISTLPALKLNLAKVRANGFAINDEEQVSGIRAVAAPVVDAAGVVIASVSVRGTTQQLPDIRLWQLGREMIRLSNEISHHLSGNNKSFRISLGGSNN